MCGCAGRGLFKAAARLLACCRLADRGFDPSPTMYCMYYRSRRRNSTHHGLENVIEVRGVKSLAQAADYRPYVTNEIESQTDGISFAFAASVKPQPFNFFYVQAM